MVQIQSSWFPRYDHNPQTFVKTIFFAQPDGYRTAWQTMWHTPSHLGLISMSVILLSDTDRLQSTLISD